MSEPKAPGPDDAAADPSLADDPHAPNDPAARLLARFTESRIVRRWARGLAGEMLLTDHEGDIVDPDIDPRIFTTVPADLGSERYAHVSLLMAGDGYLPGCLVVAAALRWHVQTRASLVCLVDDSVSAEARAMLAAVYDRVPVVARLRAHESSYPSDLLSDAYRDVYTKLHVFDAELLPYERVTFVDADLLPLRCFDHLFTVPAPAAVIESVHPTSQYAYVQHMHGVRHGEPVPPAILEVESERRRHRGHQRRLAGDSPGARAFPRHGGADPPADGRVGPASSRARRARHPLRLSRAALPAGRAAGQLDRPRSALQFHADRRAAQLRGRTGPSDASRGAISAIPGGA